MTPVTPEPLFPPLPGDLIEGETAAPEWPYPVDAFDVTREDAFVPAPAK